jgi:anti-sigma factor RsiW
MTCDDILDLIEPIAADDLTPSDEMRAHLESCPSCAAALATARRIEATLATRLVVEAPPRFAASVHQRIRRERWVEEQRVDRIFNVAIAAAVLLLVGGVLFLLRGSAVLEAAGQFLALASTFSGEAAESAAPSLGTYVAATGLFVSGLAMWWWAES